VVVTHSGTLTAEERMLVDLLAYGPAAVLAGLSAATLDGLRGFQPPATQLLMPEGRKRVRRPGVVVHYSRHLSNLDVHPVRQPPRTRITRSVLDAASWAPTDDVAIAIVASAVQQGLVLPLHLRGVLSRQPRQPRRRLLFEVIDATDGGSLSRYEVEFLRICRFFGLPTPDRQVRRQDSRGRTRFTDAEFDEFDVVAEVDGAQHMELVTWWDDLDRQNDLIIDHGKTVIRFVGLALKTHRRRVATRLHDCLRGKRPDLHDRSPCKVCRLVALGRL
jgi:very-short-patch-repair endonuclease